MRKALILGSNGPDHLSPLKYALKDAETIAAALSAPRCGFKVTMAPKLFGAQSIRSMIENLAEDCAPQDTLICYFSGHGVIERGGLFLLWGNSQPDKILSSGVPAEDILRALRYCKAESKLLVLDCCHAGAAVSSFGIKDGSGVPAEDAIPRPENFLVLMASDRLERAREFDSLGGSFLAFYLAQALGSDFHAIVARTNERRLSVQQAQRWLERKAQEHNKEHKSAPVPVPYLFGKSKGDFFITIGPDEWVPYSISWEDGSEMLLLPIHPYRNRAICLSKHPISNKQFRDVIGREPIGDSFDKDRGKWDGPFFPWRDSQFCDDNQPVVCVSYYDALEYVDSVTRIQSRRGRVTGLPDPALWDFAAFHNEFPSRRPGTWTNVSRVIHDKSFRTAHLDTLGERSNDLGLSDMIGNVWEWCTPLNSGPGRPSEIFAREPRPQLRGGGFLDDLSQTSVFLDGSILDKGRRTRHSDLGFRIAGLLKQSDLPKAIVLRLSLYNHLESQLSLYDKMSRRGKPSPID